MRKIWLSLLATALCSGCDGPVGLTDAGVDLPDAYMPDASAPDAQLPDGYAKVWVRAMGVTAPVSLRLQVSGGEELISVPQDGNTTFAAALLPGDSYAVALTAPAPCVLEDAAGTIELGADAVVVLVCGMLDDLAISGDAASDLGFVPTTLSYQAEVPLEQESLTVTATPASADMEITVAGEAVAGGGASSPIALRMGENVISVVVTHPPSNAQLTYEIIVDRAGALIQQAYAKASNTDVGDEFGRSVALSADGDTLAVGAHHEGSAATGIGGDQTDTSAPASGAVYVFQRSGATWTQQAYVKASNTDDQDMFGVSVALSATGDTLAVGANGEDSAATGIGGDQADNSAERSGAVYVFQRSDASWAQQAYVKASNTDARDGFGVSVALSSTGDTLAVGAMGEASAATGIDGDQADNTASFSGAVYVFQRSGASWTQQAYVKASNSDASDWFGWRVALSSTGDTLAVGAHHEDSAATGTGGDQTDNTAAQSGAVYVFQRSGASWTQQAYVKASNTGAGDRFGYSVALSSTGDTLAVGARWEDSSGTGIDADPADDSAEDSGAVYVFRRSGVSWAEQVYMKASNTDAGDELGKSVALSSTSETLVVGAPMEASAATGIDGDQDDYLAQHSGAVYIFRSQLAEAL